MKKIGIYSGTFDPVHEGHLAFAREAVEQCGLDKVFFLVEPRPRRKQGVRALEHRLRMVQLGIADDPRLGTIVLEQGRFSVATTWPLLQARFKGSGLYFLLGDDMLKHFNDHDWPGLDSFISSVTFVVGVRHGNQAAVRSRIKTLEQARAHRLEYTMFESPHMEISSRNIKTSLRKGGTPPGLPEAVQRYIAEHRLYAPADGSRST
jgi:nicotinate-nucleotide adenylyltransferase